MTEQPEISIGDSYSAHRLLDANLNRVQEAMRTLEDIARFRDLARFQAGYKRLRHLLANSTQSWNQNLLAKSRDAALDVGREVKTASEANREAGLAAIAMAASQRAQQALRCLEEVAKFQYPETASSIERIRYEIYDLNASLQLSLHRDLNFLRNAKLYALADCTPSLNDFVERIQAMSVAGVDIIQIREKHKDAKQILQYAQAALDCLDPSHTKIILNDRADLCLFVDAFGLHVGQDDLSVNQARKILPANSVVGLSTHDLSQVQQAVQLGADYIGCGPTFPSKTKSFDSFAGLAFLRQVVEELDQDQTPAFAIGGIDSSNVSQVLETGIQRVVVGSAIWKSPNPEIATSQIRSQLG